MEEEIEKNKISMLYKRKDGKEYFRRVFPKLTLTCKYCNKEFTVPYLERKRLYCGRTCQSKAIIRRDIRKISKCIICKKEFKHYGERILCSKECTSRYMSKNRIGKGNPNFKEIKTKRKSKGREYPKVFYDLRDNIRKRDNFTCLLCGKKEKNIKHHIHHIDYNKKNTDNQNLITLCPRCHNSTHHGKIFWEIIFSGLISGSKIVRKDWGAEIHIVNHNNYCLKYLIFFKNKEFSYHYHILKTELWHCIYGKLECILNNRSEKILIKQGDKIEINRKVIHQLHALQNSIIVEVSTRDYPEDSIRLIRGKNR